LPKAEGDTTAAPEKPSSSDKSPGEIAVYKANTWNTGVRLSVSFIDNPKPPADLRTRILSHMNAWKEYCNVEFYQVNWDGQVRITLRGNQYASYLGTDIKDPSLAGQPTMWLGSFTMQTRESEYRRVVRHETGHTLGFPHEHLRPEIVSFIDEEKAIAYFREHDGWDEETTRQNVLNPLNTNEITATVAADLHSIMCYPIDREILKDGAPDIPGGMDITSFDQSFVNWLYPKPPPTFDVLDGNPETADIVAAGDRLYKRHLDGSVWFYNRSPVAGWALIDDNRDTAKIVAADENVYQLHGNGDILVYTGIPKDWKVIDAVNPDTAQIVASKDHLYKRHKNGDVWVYMGKPKEWKLLDSNPSTVDIVAAEDELYKLHGDGEVWVYTGKHIEWKSLGEASDTVELAASKGRLYRRHRTGQVWVYNGAPNDWKQLDHFKGTAGIAADGEKLYQRRADGGIWVYTGTPLTGWQQIDANLDSQKIVASDGMLYQMHKKGRIFKYRKTGAWEDAYKHVGSR